MKTAIYTNINRSEAMRRYAIGALILGAFLVSPSMPAWVALVALYPLATAMNQWDPLNAVFEAVIRRINLHRIKQAAESLAMRSSKVEYLA